MSRRKTLPPVEELRKRYLALQGGDIDNSLHVLSEETLLLSLSIKPLRPGMKIAGPAVTWNAVIASYDPVPRETPQVKAWKKITDCIFPNSVLVYQPGGEMSSGHLGNLYANMLRARGAQGAVVDGNARDAAGHLRIANWSVFCRNSSPLEAGSRIKWMEPNRPVLMSGELRRWIEVKPGDFIFGDEDGAIVLPKRLILPVLLQAEETRKREEKAEKLYAAGEDPEKVAKKFGAA